MKNNQLRSKGIIIILSGIGVLTAALPVWACRFWVGTGVGITADVQKQLVDQKWSLKNLGSEYRDGWSIGYYYDGLPVIQRSALASSLDSRFDEVVNEVSAKETNLVFAHLRRAFSGCVSGVPNPHPFIRYEGGKTWAFGHNGGIYKRLLINLIGEDYLRKNPPVVCTENAPDSWVDSELYFIWLMRNIAGHDWDVVAGIQSALAYLYDAIPEDKLYLNFFLTDGETVWVFRKGTSLFYWYNKELKQSIVSSTIPQQGQGAWVEFPEDNMAILMPDQEIEFIKVNDDIPAKKE